MHPPALFHYLATEYLSPPPPASPEVKFWGIFIPVSERISDVTRIVYGTGGEGSGGSEEFIVEVVSRGGENGGRRKAVERVLEGWDIKQSLAVELAEMSSLKALFGQPTATVEEACPSFNTCAEPQLTYLVRLRIPHRTFPLTST